MEVELFVILQEIPSVIVPDLLSAILSDNALNLLSFKNYVNLDLVVETLTVSLFKTENNATAVKASMEILIVLVKNQLDQFVNQTHADLMLNALFLLTVKVCASVLKAWVEIQPVLKGVTDTSVRLTMNAVKTEHVLVSNVKTHVLVHAGIIHIAVSKSIILYASATVDSLVIHCQHVTNSTRELCLKIHAIHPHAVPILFVKFKERKPYALVSKISSETLLTAVDQNAY